MLAHYTYLLVDVGCVLVPLIFSFHPKINFYRQWPSFTKACFLTALFFIVWDIVFTHMAVWRFNPAYVTGLYIFNLPVEEVLFFFCVPYACMFTYYCFTLFLPPLKISLIGRYLILMLALVLFVIAITNIQKLYTSVTFLLLSYLLLFLIHRKVNYLHVFFISYAVIMVPFFISNGILTGSFIHETVVQYNDAHNLGIRLLTIPVEDIFYGMLLMLMNTAWFEYFKHRKQVTL